LEQWGPDGAGNSVLKIYRDGALVMNTSVPGSWKPAGHSVRIAASTRRAADFGAPIDAVFSNLKVWDQSGASPGAPVVTQPANVVRLNGKSFVDNSGPFLGMGASYFQALRRAKYDRTRLNSDLALLASKGMNYVRILSMVNWDGLEIAPVSFVNSAGHSVAAW